ncbi:MAG TPA: 50S ribosomal protein L15 [Nitrospiria bacterium]|nr:50S ribosomal protein L15 [Nitrospiria bacterium]
MKLYDLKPTPGSRKREKRIGRGIGSGHGKTSTKGHKGQGARSGGTKGPGFEGGQQPILRRIPKRGFRNPFRKEYAILNLSALERFPADVVVDIAKLRESGLIKESARLIKILGEGEIKKPLVVSAHKFSATAAKKIEAAGGKAEIVSL